MQHPASGGSFAPARPPVPQRVQAWIAAHPRAILLLTLLLTLAAGARLVDFTNLRLHLAIDPTLDALSVQDDTRQGDDARVQQRFGAADPILVVVRTEGGMTLDALRRVDSLSRRLAAIPGVNTIDSLTATPLPSSSDGSTTFETIEPQDLDDPALPAALARRVAQNPVVENQLVAPDRRALAIVVHPQLDGSGAIDPTAEVLAIVDDERRSGAEIAVTGGPVLRHALGDSVGRQLRRVLPAIALVLSLALALAFRSVRGVVLPLATIAIAVVWTLALLDGMGGALNLVTALVPPLLVTMGLAYGAHVLSEADALAAESVALPPHTRTTALLRSIGVPVMVTGLTTGIGLLSLTINPQSAIREFAWLSAFGVVALVVLSLTFLPAALQCIGISDKVSRPGGVTFDAWSARIGSFDRHQRRPILVVAGIVLVLALFSAARIQVGDSFVGVFPAESRVRSDYDAVNRTLGGVLPLAITFDGAMPRVFTDPAILRALDELQTWLAQQSEVGSVAGLSDHVKNLAGHVLGPQAAQIPASAEAVGQLLLFGDGELLRSYVNVDRSATIIRLRLRVDDTTSIDRLLTRLNTRLTELPAAIVARPVGEAVRMTDSVRQATDGQLRSVALALGLIWLCLSVQFLSLKIGLLAAVPTAVQTALYFGSLGLLGIPLNASTALVECLVLGLAVDDTIHYLARFNRAARDSGSEKVAADQALRAVLRPVTLTKGILALGFLTMLSGELRNQVQFGWLAALTLFSSWLVDAFFTPAFVGGLRIVTLWDTLRLDLGADVQTSIPLFAGLSDRQARVFALMANLQTLPAGSRLMAEGDAPGNIYVLIDGEVSVNVEREGQRVEISTLKRGAVVGERGFFGARRSANVDALTPVRLLSFDEADQQRLLRAYPAIAARVFLALNRIQAERYAQAAK